MSSHSPAAGSKSERRAAFAATVEAWLSLFRDEVVASLGAEVSSISDTMREEVQIRCEGRLIMVGLVHERGDEDATDIAAQAANTELLRDGSTEIINFFHANATLSLYRMEQGGGTQRFFSITDAQNLDRKNGADLARIRTLLPRLLLQNASQLIPIRGQRQSTDGCSSV